MRIAFVCVLGLCMTTDVWAQEPTGDCGPGARGRGARAGGAPVEAPARAARAGGGPDELFARFASRPANLVSGPALGYTAALAGLQWPTGAGNEETSTASVAVDSRDHIFVYHRPEAGRAPLLEFDATGKFVKAFGTELQIVRAHGMRIDASDNIWITDVNSHTVSKLDRNGKLLMTLGTKGKSGKWSVAGGTQLFDQPTDVGFDGAGNTYVANSHGGPDPRVDKFDASGKYVSTMRVQPKEGNCANVHTIAVDKSGTVYASSREQRLIRVYDTKGSLLRTLEMPALVSGLHIDRSGQLWMTTGLDGQLMRIDKDSGKLVAVAGRGHGQAPDQFGEAHFLAMNAKGDIYIADTVLNRVVKFTKQ
jgi:tripartite motif-containing protein 71